MNAFDFRIGRSTFVVYGLAMAIVFGLAFFVRVYFPYDNVFTGDWVRFQINDPWYHMRMVENLVHHFPSRMPIDPYGIYPGGQEVNIGPFYDLLMGFFIWLFGVGSPSKGLIETLGAYFPAILGALTTIPVYFIGKELCNKKAGLIAAALIAVMPGQFLMRTLLGFTDHHAAETLLSTMAMLFLILAVKSSQQQELSFNSVRAWDWSALKKPLLYSLLTGISLGLYFLSWTGASLFIFIIFIFAIVQYVIDHLRGRSTDYLCITGVFSLFIALLMIAPASGEYSLWNIQFASLLIGIFAFLIMSGLSSFMTGKNIRQAYFPLALAALGGIGALLFWLIEPTLWSSMWDKINVLSPTGGELTIAEARRLDLSDIWSNFTTGFYLSLISLAMVLYLVIKEKTADKTLFFIWSLIMIIAAFGQMRFAYYLAANVALLTGYITWRMLEYASLEEATREAERKQIEERARQQKEKAKLSKKAKRKKEKAKKRRQETLVTRLLSMRIAFSMIALVIVFFLVFYPSIGMAVFFDGVEYSWAGAQRGPTDDWHDALVWLKENTPDPFQDPDFFYELYEKPADGASYNYPASVYGVMSWWDYGYWITYLAHRIPNANPTQENADWAGRFFTSAEVEPYANTLLDKMRTKYVVIDYEMITRFAQREGQYIPVGKFYAMVEWANRNLGDFYEPYYLPGTGTLWAFYPEYYQSLCCRLYLFEGKEWTPRDSTYAILSTVRTDSQGNKYKAITDIANDKKPFTTYEDAMAFVQANPGYQIVGFDPYNSPVPLEELENYKLVHKSPSTLINRGDKTVSLIEIFEYSP
ncbi:MAG TPA: oligosaccharyl transferase, archaeosortase A system-associated [Dehalococcoidia bacterium]|nr:oligosaccharyl transferase, archaeosortase A system-associated [Dehalococcoidia bacterium]